MVLACRGRAVDVPAKRGEPSEARSLVSARDALDDKKWK